MADGRRISNCCQGGVLDRTRPRATQRIRIDWPESVALIAFIPLALIRYGVVYLTPD